MEINFNNYIISQILVVGAYLLLGIGLSKKKYSQILIFTIVYSALMIIQYALLRGTMGIISNCINLCRNIVFYKNNDKGTNNNKTIVHLFYLITIVLSIIFSSGLIDIFPCMLAILGTYAYSNNEDTKRVRVCSIICSICYIIYAIPLKSYMNIFCEVYVIGQTIRGYIKYEITK